MGDFSKMDSSQDSVGSYSMQNSYSSYNRLAGVDNMVFWSSEPYTITSGNTTRESVPNHLMNHRPEGEDNGVSLNNKIYKSNGVIENFGTIRDQPTYGYTIHKAHDKYGLGKSQTLGRRTIITRPPVETLSRRPHTTIGTMSRQQRRSDNGDAISFFDIEMDKVSSFQYRPGEEITGAIHFIVRKSVEIRFVDIIVTGQGLITTRRSSDGIPHTYREIYLQKEKCIIGSKDVLLGSLLKPGQYKSMFRVKLPKDLPSTVRNEDKVNGLMLNICYTIKVRFCDDIGTSSSRYAASPSYNKVRVFLEKQMNFNVRRGFDLTSIPDAMSPITHTEQIYLSCTHQEAAIVSVNLDRAVFLAGDDIRMQLQVSLPSSLNVKEITCRLQQLVKISPKHEPFIFILSKIISKDPFLTGRKTTNHNTDENALEITVPTNTELISPFSLGNSKMKVEYSLVVDLKFVPAGGKLSFKIPVGIGPSADPIYAEKSLSKKLVPLFNRTTRFPCFSTKTLVNSGATKPGNFKHSASVQVTTKYFNGPFARVFLCCMGARDT